MPVVDLVILGHTHRLTCQAGEEDRLRALADKFRMRVEAASKNLQTADYRLVYLVAGLTLLDEMEDNAGSEASKTTKDAMKEIYNKVISIHEDLS